MLPNVSVAPNRNKLTHYVHLAGTCCTHRLALYWLLVFIHETHVMPSSFKVKTKQEQITTLRGSGTGCTHLLAFYWLMVFIHETHVMPSSGKVKINRNKLPHYVVLVLLAPIFWHYIDWWCLLMKHMCCHRGKVKTKRHLFSYLVLAGSECCLMCKLLQTGKNYHITYIWMVLVAPFFYHYIDWWCLFMKHMCCHLVAK